MATLAVLIYLAAVILAVGLVAFLKPIAWHYHVLAVLVALGLGMAKIPEQWSGPSTDLAVGFCFTFLLLWGLAGLIFREGIHHKHA
jgi:hypothetical protein